MSSPSPVPPEQCLAVLTEWRDSTTRGVAELVGAKNSGRTRTLLRLHEVSPDTVFVDATGLTSEDFVARVMAAAGLDMPRERRADWDRALRNSSFAGSTVIIANTQRAGRTRRSSEPHRLVHSFAVTLAAAGRLKVVVERDPPDTERWHRNLVVTLQPGADAQPVSQRLLGLDEDLSNALRALAMAELRRVPVAVWSVLAQALRSRTSPVLDIDAALRSASMDGLVGTGDDGWVFFRDERIAEALREDTAPDVVRSVNLHLVRWLRDQRPTGDVGRYLSQGLAMHAVQSGQFNGVQRSGSTVAHLDQVALIDAALCDGSGRIDGDSPAGDAVNLWNCGVDSLPQGEWASWLHLMSTARGDLRTAADIAAGGPRLPWRTRWARWRPPGGRGAEFVQPGPLAQVVRAPGGHWPGRSAVMTQGTWDERYRVWDAETGDSLAGPWPDAQPGTGQHEPLFPATIERDVTPSWDDLTVFDALAPPFLADRVRVGDTVVVVGLGGLFAVQSSTPATDVSLGDIHGEPMIEDHCLWPVPYTRQLHTDADAAPYDARVFTSDEVRRLPRHRIPEGLTDAEARRALTDVGLPAFQGADVQLIALDEQGLTELCPASRPEAVPAGAFYTIGTGAGGTVAVHGPSGQVHLMRGDAGSGSDDFSDGDVTGDVDTDDDDVEEAEDDSPTLIASSVTAFVAMLQQYLIGRCVLASSGSRLERMAVRDECAISLSAIDEAGSASPFWTTGFSESYWHPCCGAYVQDRLAGPLHPGARSTQARAGRLPAYGARAACPASTLPTARRRPHDPAAAEWKFADCPGWWRGGHGPAWRVSRRGESRPDPRRAREDGQGEQAVRPSHSRVTSTMIPGFHSDVYL